MKSLLLWITGIAGLSNSLFAQAPPRASLYCDTCTVHYPVMMPDQTIQLEPLYFVTGKGKLTTVYNERPLTVYYNINPATNLGAISGWNADTSVWFTGSFILDTTRIADVSNQEDTANPGTFHSTTQCCYYRLRGEYKWETKFRDPAGVVTYSVKRWREGVREGEWKETTGKQVRVSGMYEHGKKVGTWITPAEHDTYFFERFDSIGRPAYTAVLYYENDKKFNEEIYSTDSVPVLLETDSGSLRLNVRRSEFRHFSPGQQVDQKSFLCHAIVGGEYITFCDSSMTWHPDGSVAKKVIRKGKLYEVTEYYPGGNLKFKGVFAEWRSGEMQQPRGEHQRWNENGKLQEKKIYDGKGKLLKTSTYK